MTNFSLDTIQQDFKIHDSYQIEIKLDYSLIENKNSQYQVHTYFFIPYSLGINSSRYSSEEISSNILNYIRLRTPQYNFDEFLVNDSSPIAVIEKLIDSPDWRKNVEINNQIIEQLKLLGAMLKTAIRDHIDLIHQRLLESPTDTAAAHYLESLIKNYSKGASKVCKAYRKLLRSFNTANISSELFQAYQITDEFISTQFEEGAVDIYQMLDEYFKNEDQANLVQEFQKGLRDLALAEIDHREAMGYRSILQKNGHNEVYVYLLSALKKVTADVLHLKISEQKEGVLLEQIGFAIAAGMAMLFATIVAFYFQANYGSLTFPVFIALVVGYMFKDRLKELMREWISGALVGKFFDQRIIIRKEGKRQKLGTIKKKVFFSKYDRVPKKVRRKREEAIIDILDDEFAGESVLCHAREINLRANAFQGIFSSSLPVSGINDIIRIDIRFLLNRMDEPVDTRYVLGEDGLHSVKVRRVYYVYVVSKYKSISPYKETLYILHRVVLSRKGIVRVEHLD
ncbi:MAG TPA: hypothetical protein VJ965_12280 [Anaerolineales bacterium]|nr:hypothetical protein [Anaerolineales bacterium]